MGLSVKQGVVSSPAATGSQATSGLGFQPKVVIFHPVKLTAAGFGADTRVGFGWAIDSTHRRAVSVAHNTGGIQSGMRQRDDSCISLGGNAGAVELAADFTSMDADGFTLNWATVVSGAKVPYLALGGTDLTNVASGTFALNTSTGNKAVTGVGFKPDCVILAMTQFTTDPNAGAGGFLSIGMASGTSARGALSYVDQNTTPSAVASVERTDSILTQITSAGTNSIVADLVSFDSDGFTINESVAPGSAYQVEYLALKGPQFKVGSETQATSATTKATTVGFSPLALLFMGMEMTAGAASDATICRLTLGSTDGTNQAATWGEVQDNSATAEARSAYTNTKAVGHYARTSSIVAEAGISSLDANGFTLNWTTADATAREFLYLAVGAAAVAATGGRSALQLLGVG